MVVTNRDVTSRDVTSRDTGARLLRTLMAARCALQEVDAPSRRRAAPIADQQDFERRIKQRDPRGIHRPGIRLQDSQTFGPHQMLGRRVLARKK